MLKTIGENLYGKMEKKGLERNERGMKNAECHKNVCSFRGVLRVNTSKYCK